MPPGFNIPRLTNKQFEQIRHLLYDTARISLKDGKESLVEGRLSKRLRPLGLADYDAYLNYLQADKGGQELAIMVDALTTNKTSFFREDQHFDFLSKTILPALRQRATGARFWCAGCSSGEEPYTMAMLLREAWSDVDQRDPRILATDISFTVLEAARKGLYSEGQLADVPTALLRKYFIQGADSTPGMCEVAEPVRRLVRFAGLNLMDNWPMRGPFRCYFLPQCDDLF